MRDIRRQYRILHTISKVWALHPDLRLGQLLIVVANMSGWHNSDIFHFEDDKLLEALEKFYKDTLDNKQ
jgi:hypothetical protein